MPIIFETYPMTYTLLQTVKALENAAASEPPVQMIVRNDIFRLNQCPNAKYAAFGWLQGEHQDAGELMRFNFTLFYVDRLRFDKANELEIQSVGIQVLGNILGKVNELGLEPDGISYRTFNQRFADLCAGVYTTVTLEVPKGNTCVNEYEDYTNDDILIY